MNLYDNFAEWDKLHTFYHVVKLKTLSRTAEYLNTSQPALTKAIQLLEYRLKVQLFIRQPKGMVLTREGEELFKVVEKFYGELYKVKHSLHEKENELKSYLRIAATTGFVSQYLIYHLPEFLRRYPDLKVTVHGTDTSPDFDLYEADVIIHPYIKDRNDIVHVPLMTVHYKLYASPNYLAKYGTPQEPEDLDNHKLIGFGDHSHPYSVINWHLVIGSENDRPREPYVQINSAQARFDIAEAGFGIMTAPADHKDLQGRKLVEVLPHIVGPTIDMFCIYPRKLEGSKRIQVFIDYLTAVFAHKRS